MKKSLIAILLIVAIAVAATAALAGPKKSLNVAGSTTVLPLAQLWVEAFVKKHPDVSASVSGGGTGTGISMLLNGTCNIANASREAKKKEIDTAKARNSRLVATKLAKDGLAIIVHPSNNVKNLTLDQIAAIYKGKAGTWREVGGDSSKSIVVVGRDNSSGTYGFFQETVLGGSLYVKTMLCQPSNAGVAQAVAQSEGAIGYVGMAYATEAAEKNKVKIISVSRKKGEPGMIPTEENVKNGKYPLFRFLYAYTLGNPKGLAAEYLKFGLSPEGQAMVTKAGYIPLK